MNIREAHSVATIAHELLGSVDEHHHLRDATILHLFSDQDPAARMRGCRRYGRVKAATTWDTFLFHWGTADPGDQSAERGLEFRYALIVFEKPWSTLSPARRRFVVDELLSHCQVVENEVSGEQSFVVAQHGYQGFQGVLQRHGGEALALDAEDAELVRTAHQLPLPAAPEVLAQAELPDTDSGEPIERIVLRAGDLAADDDDDQADDDEDDAAEEPIPYGARTVLAERTAARSHANGPAAVHA